MPHRCLANQIKVRVYVAHSSFRAFGGIQKVMQIKNAQIGVSVSCKRI